VVPLAASCLRILSYGNIGYAYGMVMLQAFNGAGDTVDPDDCLFFRFLVAGRFRSHMCWRFRLHLHSKGVFLSIVIARRRDRGRGMGCSREADGSGNRFKRCGT